MSEFELIHFDITHFLKLSYFQSFILTLCGTRKLQFFYAEILLELKNRPMPKTVNAIYKQTIKVKNSFKISGIHFSRWESWVSVVAPDTLCFKWLRDSFLYFKNVTDTKAFFFSKEITFQKSFLFWNKNRSAIFFLILK